MSVQISYYRNRNENDDADLLSYAFNPPITVQSLAYVDYNSTYDFSNGWKGLTCWNTERDGSGTSYYPGDTLDTSTSLYAIWHDPHTVTVKDTMLTAIAETIRMKTGKTDALSFPDDFISEIGTLRK